MKLRAPGPSPIRVRPVRPNVGTQLWYQSELEKHVEAMMRSVEFLIKQTYAAEVVPTLATDSPTSKLQTKIDQLAGQWTKTFDHTSQVTAKAFSNKVLTNNNVAFKSALSKSGFSVEMQMTPSIAEGLSEAVAENVDLIKSIPGEYLDSVRELVMESVEKGRAMKELTEMLHEVGGVSMRRAAFIARDQNNKISARFQKTRQKEFGIQRARWIHSMGSVHPREEHAEWDASGETYDVDVGMWSEEAGEYVWPGTDYNCGCVSESIIEGYNDEGEGEEFDLFAEPEDTEEEE